MRLLKGGAVVSLRIRSSPTFRAHMEERKLAARAIAAKAQVNKSFIYALLEGRKGCKPATAQRIAKAFGQPPIAVDLLFETRVFLPEGQASSLPRPMSSKSKRRAA